VGFDLGNPACQGLVSETISTLLLNYVAILLVNFFVFGPWKDRKVPTTRRLQSLSMPPHCLPLAHTCSHGVHLCPRRAHPILFCSFQDAVGSRDASDRRQSRSSTAQRNSDQRLYYPPHVYRRGLAGLAGMIEVSAIQGRLRPSLSPGYGFIGFLISWMAGGNPLGIVAAAFLLAIVTAGGDILQMAHGLPGSAVNILTPSSCSSSLLGRAERVESNDRSSLQGLLSGSIIAGTPLLLCHPREVIGERAGIINLGLEGVMLIGAAVGFSTTVQTGNPRWVSSQLLWQGLSST